MVNLLIEMARSACKSNRKEVIFDPFPTVIHPLRPTEFILHPKKVDGIHLFYTIHHDINYCNGYDRRKNEMFVTISVDM